MLEEGILHRDAQVLEEGLVVIGKSHVALSTSAPTSSDLEMADRRSSGLIGMSKLMKIGTLKAFLMPLMMMHCILLDEGMTSSVCWS